MQVKAKLMKGNSYEKLLILAKNDFQVHLGSIHFNFNLQRECKTKDGQKCLGVKYKDGEVTVQSAPVHQDFCKFGNHK